MFTSCCLKMEFIPKSIAHRFDTNKSTKGASKLRRDLINAEIANLRELLPLPPSSRQRLSQLQLMALVCVYVRKENYFQQVFKRPDVVVQQISTPNIGFSKALCGFLMMMTQNGKLLYISDNAAEYLGHSMEDLLIHGDSVYDIIDKQDHQAIQDELGRASTSNSVPGTRVSTDSTLHNDVTRSSSDESRIFLCRMNVSRNARRQMRFGDQKVVLVRGHFLSFLPLCSRNEPVFLATCTPIAMPETRECVVQGATNVFTSIHSLDMKFLHIDKNGEFYLEYTKCELQGTSWYRFLHWECIREAQAKHRSIIQSEQDRTCILLVRLQRRSGEWLWVHSVLQVKDNMDNSQNAVIVCTNQVLSENEAIVMYTNGWFYHYYMVQNKFQYGLNSYDTHGSSNILSYYQQDNKYNTSQNSVPYQGFGAGPPIPQSNQYLPRSTLFSSSSNSLPQQKLNDQYQNQRSYRQHLNRLRSDIEPVDYSVHTNNHEDVKEGSMDASSPVSVAASKPIMIPLHNKRRVRRMTTYAAVDIEPLKLNSISLDSTPTSLLTDLEHMCLPSPGSGSEILLVPTAATVPLTSITLQYALARSRLSTKTATGAEFTDFREEWNPSPPWSDSLQKVPDIAYQDTGSYVGTNSPTPTGTPSTPRSSYMTFTFDWPPEQYVPNINPPNAKPVDPKINAENQCEYDTSHSSHPGVSPSEPR